MAATTASIRYYTTRAHPCGGRVRSIRGAGWPRSAFGMTRSDFQKDSSSAPIPNLAWNTGRKVYDPWTGDFEDLGTDPSFGRNALAARKYGVSKSARRGRILKGFVRFWTSFPFIFNTIFRFPDTYLKK